MVDREIKPEYYTEVDDACRVLYELELDISPDDNTLSAFTEDERIANKAFQRAFWLKFDPNTLHKSLDMYTGRDFALKYWCSKGNIAAHENWSNYPNSMQRQFQSKLEELTSKDFLEKRVNHVCQFRCDKCKKHRGVFKCFSCEYGRYCSVECRLDDKSRHRPVCHFLVKYLDWKKRFG